MFCDAFCKQIAIGSLHLFGWLSQAAWSFFFLSTSLSYSFSFSLLLSRGCRRLFFRLVFALEFYETERRLAADLAIWTGIYIVSFFFFFFFFVFLFCLFFSYVSSLSCPSYFFHKIAIACLTHDTNNWFVLITAALSFELLQETLSRQLRPN